MSFLHSQDESIDAMWKAVALTVVLPGLWHIASRRRMAGYFSALTSISLASLSIAVFVQQGSNPEFALIASCFALALFGVLLIHIGVVFRHAHTFTRNQTKSPSLALLLNYLLPGLGGLYLGFGFGVVIIVFGYVVGFFIPDNQVTSFAGNLLFTCAVMLFYARAHPSPDSTQRRAATNLALLLIAQLTIMTSVSHVLRSFIAVQPYSGISNFPTLHDGDRILVYHSPGDRLKRGDVVQIAMPASRLLIKRAIAFPNEHVSITNGAVFIDGRPVPSLAVADKLYVTDSLTRFGLPDSPFLVPHDSLFVLGDNSSTSEDSRYFGPVPLSSVIGKPVMVVWPLKRCGRVIQPSSERVAG